MAHPSELWNGFWGIQVLQTGQSLGLFQSLTEAKSASELAQERGLEPRYTLLWCEAATNFGLLERSQEQYQTPIEHSDWLIRSKGFTQSHLHLSRRMNETLTAVFGGRALPEPPVSLRLLLQENLQANYDWLFREASAASETLENMLTGSSRVLEVGCGLGFGLSHLRAYYPSLELFGLEADYECAQEAERSTKAIIHVGELPGNRFAQGFDLVVCFRTLTATTDPAALLAECSQLLKSDGLFLLGTEVTDDDRQRKSEARVQGERLAYNVLAGESLRHAFSTEQLRELLQNSGFTIDKELEAPDWATPAFLCSVTRE